LSVQQKTVEGKSNERKFVGLVFMVFGFLVHEFSIFLKNHHDHFNQDRDECRKST